MAGPWFAVHRVGDDWKTLDTIWISNGDKTDKAVVQTRLEFADDRITKDVLAGARTKDASE